MSQVSDLSGRPSRPDPRLARVGVFTLIALGLCLAVIFAIAGPRWFKRSVTLETYFNESVQGLEVGSKVKYRGVVLGQVTHIGFTSEQYEPGNPEAAIKPYVLVEAHVRPDMLGFHRTWDESLRRQEIAKGLRVKLASQGLTGTSYLEMDYVDPSANPPLPIDWTPEHIYVPSAPSTMNQIFDAAQQTLNQVQHLDLKATVANLNRLLDSLDRSVKAFDAQGLSRRTDATLRQIERVPFTQLGQQAQALLAELRQTNRTLQHTLASPALGTGLQDLQAAAAQARKLTADPALAAAIARADRITRQLDRLLAGRSAEIGDAIDNLREISDNLRDFSETLKNQPSAVLFSRPAPPLERGR